MSETAYQLLAIILYFLAMNDHHWFLCLPPHPQSQ